MCFTCLPSLVFDLRICVVGVFECEFSENPGCSGNFAFDDRGEHELSAMEEDECGFVIVECNIGVRQVVWQCVEGCVDDELAVQSRAFCGRG